MPGEQGIFCQWMVGARDETDRLGIQHLVIERQLKRPATDATDDGDKPTLNITATDATATEGVADDVLVYQVSQTNPSNFDTVAHVSLSGAVSAADVAQIVYTDANGAVQTVTDPAAIQALFTNGFDVKIPTGSTTAPAITAPTAVEMRKGTM